MIQAFEAADHEAKRYALGLPLVSTLPSNQLRRTVGSVAHSCNEIASALDRLFFGI